MRKSSSNIKVGEWGTGRHVGAVSRVDFSLTVGWVSKLVASRPLLEN